LTALYNKNKRRPFHRQPLNLPTRIQTKLYHYAYIVCVYQSNITHLYNVVCGKRMRGVLWAIKGAPPFLGFNHYCASA